VNRITLGNCRGLSIPTLRPNSVNRLDRYLLHQRWRLRQCWRPREALAWCDGLGHHHRVLDVSGYPDDVPVPAFGPRMVCTVCGAGADARPNWNERAPVCLFGAKC
jgi:hypothetical protein